ncbi:flagellin [Devosia neptuniae]|jgi:flagellin|uniref:flagellin N-terminal helical domain-containing protein n=1 Tax=Devosia TaxID=46913 RepID=UPI0022AE8A4E|nr:flagellin [Devosia neptuniae]MCZ4345869.1 flagellin [Devosia neptuniae]|tara:strand:- start:47966 stop:49777 length:1812 start_codon:yes stop_codon:yes gene_type:complete
MSDISLSKAVRSNLLALQGTADMMAVAQTRLSTGNKVNSALDNPSNWFTAKGLTNRSSDLNALMDSMANGIQTLKAADNGLSAMTKTLESMQSTLRQARQDKSFQTASLSVDATAIGTSAAKELTFSGGAFAADQTTSLTNTLKPANNGFVGPGATLGRNGNVTLQATSLNGGSSITVALTDTDTASTAAEKINTALGAASGGTGGLTASVVNGQLSLESTKGETVTVGGTAAQHAGLTAGAATTAVTASLAPTGGTDFTANTNDPDLSALSGKTLTLSSGSTTVSYTFDATTTGQLAALKSALGGASGFTIAENAAGLTFSRVDGSNFDVTASDTTLGTAVGIGANTTARSTNGAIASGTVTTITDTFAAKTVDQLVASINADTNLTGKIRASNDNGKLRIENQSTQKLDIEGASNGKIDGSTSTSQISGNSVRAGLASQFNELRDQLDKLADDASFNGINLMRGDKLTITFNETGTSSIDIQTKNGGTINSANLGVPTSLEEEQLDSDTTIDSLLTDMKAALDSVRSQASTFGSNLSIVQNRQDFTKAMIDTLETGAGNLTLADMNEEAANLLALQTRQQLSSNSLSLASQADQSILQLLR